MSLPSSRLKEGNKFLNVVKPLDVVVRHSKTRGILEPMPLLKSESETMSLGLKV